MASLNFPPTKRASWRGLISSPKLWVKLICFGLIFGLLSIVLSATWFSKPLQSWRLNANSIIGDVENPLGLDWVIADQQTLFFNTQAGYTIAAEQQTGRVQWLRQTDADSPFPPFFIDAETIGIITINSEVFAFDTKTGKTRWIFEPTTFAQPDTPALVDGAMIYFADRTGKLFAINKNTGILSWQVQFKTLPLTSVQSDQNPLVHFGLMNQSEKYLVVNHNPEKSLITIAKQNGQRLTSIPQEKFLYQMPALAGDQPIFTSSVIHSTKPNSYLLNGATFTLCQNQTALCKNPESEFQTQPVIAIADFLQRQQKITKLKKLLPKLTQDLSVTNSPTISTVNQPIDWNFSFTDVTINNIWTEVTAELTLQEKKSNQKIKLTAYPLNQTQWRATAKLPTEGEWSWSLNITSPTQQRNATGKLTVTAAETPKTFSWQGLGFQDAFIDWNNNYDSFDQMYLGISAQPPTDASKITFTDFNQYLNTYADSETGFTAFRWSVDNFNFKLWREISPTNFQLSLKGGVDGDTLVRAVAAKKLNLDLDVFGFKPPLADQKQLTWQQRIPLKKYLQYMVGRYGAYVTSWEIGNEVTPSDAWVGEVAALLRSIDPYKNPISINWQRDPKLGLDFISLHHYYSLEPQMTQGEFLKIVAQYAETQNPVMFTELGNHGESWDPQSAARFRIRIWTAFMTQTPVFFWAQNGTVFKNASNANVYLGPVERKSVSTLRKLTRGSSPRWLAAPITSQNPYLSALALQNEKTVWIYVTNTQANTKSSGKLTLANLKIDTVTWYDPATGTLIGKSNTLQTPSFSQDLIGIVALSL